MVLDMLDGRIARMTGTASEFGVQLDSLADIISFGMAPAVLAYAWGLAPLGRLGWADRVPVRHGRGAAAGAIQHPEEHRQALLRGTRQSGGGRDCRVDGVLLSIGTARQRPKHFSRVALVLVPALLMVSTLRFRSFKTIDLGERRRYQMLIVLAALLALIVTYPHEVLLIMAYAYLASGFVDLALHKVRRREAEPLPRTIDEPS